jgi:hypothetical protein
VSDVYAKTAWAGASTEVPVLNPGGWFGRTWLVEAKFPDGRVELLIVEAEDREMIPLVLRAEDTHQDWLDSAVELNFHGQKRKQMPWKCRYFGKGLPERGISPLRWEDEGENES